MRITLLLVVLLFASFCSPAWAADWLATGGMTATALNEYGAGWVASTTVDGNTGEPGWISSNTNVPIWLRVDMAVMYEIARFGYQPRVDDSFGRIKDFEVYVTNSTSTSKADWGAAAATGQFLNNDQRQDFDVTPTRGRYFVL